jgi:hypothetical protein
MLTKVWFKKILKEVLVRVGFISGYISYVVIGNLIVLALFAVVFGIPYLAYIILALAFTIVIYIEIQKARL